ncbi:small RNA degrading nuclease 1-like [Bidens hawaiensis]|uniref:small RNA degrading nuclease 1-like n=1 Tax=Bidens hawaiensis TaxID=980011 RepID=UPI0040498269
MCQMQELVHKTVSHPYYALDYLLPSHEEGWVIIKNKKKLKEARCNTILAVDCEMVLCDDGTDALVRVCVVDRDEKVVLDELVKPDKEVVDYRSHITGICAEDLENVTTTLQDVQEIMKKLLSKGTILAGHSLNSDLKALKIDHSRVIDTSLIFKYWSGSNFKRISLNNLCKMVLGQEVRVEGDTHDCLDDARFAMKLVVAKLNGVADNINNSKLSHQNEVHEANAMKLLCHRIPIDISKEKLVEIIPGDFTIELKPNRKGGDKYSAFLVFESKQDADKAFEELVGDLVKDSSGRSQKLVLFKLRSVGSGSLYVRKMALDGEDDNTVQVASVKRSAEDETPIQVKKLKTDKTPEPKETGECNMCDRYLNEIETLKKQLHERDQEITMLNKIIVAQARKQSGV